MVRFASVEEAALARGFRGGVRRRRGGRHGTRRASPRPALAPPERGRPRREPSPAAPSPRPARSSSTPATDVARNSSLRPTSCWSARRRPRHPGEALLDARGETSLRPSACTRVRASPPTSVRSWLGACTDPDGWSRADRRGRRLARRPTVDPVPRRPRRPFRASERSERASCGPHGARHLAPTAIPGRLRTDRSRHRHHAASIASCASATAWPSPSASSSARASCARPGSSPDTWATPGSSWPCGCWAASWRA